MRMSKLERYFAGLGVLALTARCLSILFVVLLCQEALAAPAGTRKPVWIDTDPACGQGAMADVDDCWALLLALSSPELYVHGMSTVFGNVDEETAFVVARSVLDRLADSGSGDLPTIYRGAQRAGGGATSPAIAALATALERDRLTILALGPLTNVAALLAEHPQLAGNIDRIVAVGGTRPPQRRLFPGTNRLLHFHDLNFVKDPAAFEAILQSGVSLSLLPFEAAQKVTVAPADLSRLASGGPLARWLAGVSLGWMRFWRDQLGTDGFHPFDSLAVGYVIEPLNFLCEQIPVRVQRMRSLFVARDTLAVSHSFERSTSATYCSDVDPTFKSKVLARLVELGGIQ